MAKTKTGFIYYNIDTDRYQDKRIKRLRKDLGCNGVAVYDYILCEIYRVKGCFIKWDEDTAYDVADYWGLKETQVNEIVNYCCSVGLFNKALLTNGGILSSSSIQSRYLEMSLAAKRKNVKIPEECKIIPEECAKVPEETEIIPEEIPLSKVKESKVEESKEVTPPSVEVVLPFADLKKRALANQTFVETYWHWGVRDQNLSEWMEAYHKRLLYVEKTIMTDKEYRDYFGNWLKFQNYRTGKPSDFNPAREQKQQPQPNNWREKI